MRLLTRYVLSEVFKIFAVTLTSLTILMVVFLGAKEALQQGLGPLHILQLVPYLIPNALLYAVPGTILFAASSVYGRLAGSNEIVAIKSLGISPMAFLWPTFVLATALSFVTVWLNDVAMTWSHQGILTVGLNAVEDIAYGTLRAQRSYSTKDFSVNVDRVEGRRLILPTFTFQSKDKQSPDTVTADEAELISDRDEGVLIVVFRNATILVNGTQTVTNAEVVRRIPLDQARRIGGLSPSHMALREIPERIARQHVLIHEAKQAMAANAASAMLTGDFDKLGPGPWHELDDALYHHRELLFKLRTEPPRRWANGFSCLCFALVGAPMAIRLRNADALTSFFLCFLPILLIYYPLMLWGVDRSKAGAVSPYAVWVDNAILAAWGLWMLRKVIRY